jgi:hypothetical protein
MFLLCHPRLKPWAMLLAVGYLSCAIVLREDVGESIDTGLLTRGYNLSPNASDGKKAVLTLSYSFNFQHFM